MAAHALLRGEPGRFLEKGFTQGLDPKLRYMSETELRRLVSLSGKEFSGERLVSKGLAVLHAHYAQQAKNHFEAQAKKRVNAIPGELNKSDLMQKLLGSVFKQRIADVVSSLARDTLDKEGRHTPPSPTSSRFEKYGKVFSKLEALSVVEVAKKHKVLGAKRPSSVELDVAPSVSPLSISATTCERPVDVVPPPSKCQGAVDELKRQFVVWKGQMKADELAHGPRTGSHIPNSQGEYSKLEKAFALGAADIAEVCRTEGAEILTEFQRLQISKAKQVVVPGANKIGSGAAPIWDALIRGSMVAYAFPQFPQDSATLLLDAYFDTTTAEEIPEPERSAEKPGTIRTTSEQRPQLLCCSLVGIPGGCAFLNLVLSRGSGKYGSVVHVHSIQSIVEWRKVLTKFFLNGVVTTTIVRRDRTGMGLSGMIFFHVLSSSVTIKALTEKISEESGALPVPLSSRSEVLVDVKAALALCAKEDHLDLEPFRQMVVEARTSVAEANDQDIAAVKAWALVVWVR